MSREHEKPKFFALSSKRSELGKRKIGWKRRRTGQSGIWNERLGWFQASQQLRFAGNWLFLLLYLIMFVPGLQRSRNFFLGHVVTLHAPVVLRVFPEFLARATETGNWDVFHLYDSTDIYAVATRGCNLSFIICCGNYDEVKQLQAESIRTFFLSVGSALTRQLP